MSLLISEGNLVLAGPLVETLAHAFEVQIPRPSTSSPCYLFVASERELQDINSSKFLKRIPDTRYVLPVGLGSNKEKDVYHVVVIWNAGQLLRKQLGLSPSDLYIPLRGPISDSLTHRGIGSLLTNPALETSNPILLDHLCVTLQQLGEFDHVIDYAQHMVLADNRSSKGFIRIADASFKLNRAKLSMLCYAAAFDRTDDNAVQEYCVKRLEKCSHQTEWGVLFLEDEMKQIPARFLHVLLRPWSESLHSRLSEQNILPTLTLLPKQYLSVPLQTIYSSTTELHTLPRWFRWLVPFRVAILSTPRNQQDVGALGSPYIGIKRIVTLTEEEPLHPSFFRSRRITNTFLPIRNYYPPTIEQMDQIVSLMQDEANLPLAFHCGGGRGRAGTVAACYLAAFGFGSPIAVGDHPVMAASEAIATLRSIRPGSIETPQQEAFVSQWCSIIWKRRSVLPEVPSEPAPCPFHLTGTLQTSHDLLMLVGLPGSGKSWFSRALMARHPNQWQYISQDESGSRAACEREIGHASKRIILDRCNVSRADRQQWLALASSSAASPICVYFEYDRDLCISRAQRRSNHPTLPAGNRVLNAAKQMSEMFTQPTLEEGFSAVVTIRSFEAAISLVTHLSPSLGIYKFPRTAHLIDLGAVSSDDILEPHAVNQNTIVSLTEKVDGANMGLSLSSDRSRVIVQNRSHYVNSASHEQFKKLGLWIENHKDVLIRILGSDEFFAERYILFGEWLYATHSIAYTRLPDLFMAFDLYDRSSQTWATRAVLEDLLVDTAITLVPQLYYGPMPSEKEITDMTHRPSLYYDGPLEGIYIKAEANGCVVSRQKVVRRDFICGNQHWSKEKLRVNQVLVT
jgi:atypical dual specificity phosphatase